MRKFITLLIVALFALNIPLMLSGDAKAAITHIDPDGIPAQFYDDFEGDLGNWTVSGQAWISANASTAGSQSVYMFDGGINRTFSAGNNTNVTVEVEVLDFYVVAFNDSFAGLYVYNSTTSVFVGVVDQAREYTTYTTSYGWGSWNGVDWLSSRRSAGWHNWQIYLHDGKAAMMVDHQIINTLNLTDPIGYGFNTTDNVFLGTTPKALYIDQLFVHMIWQSDFYEPVALATYLTAPSPQKIEPAGIFYNATSGNYTMYYSWTNLIGQLQLNLVNSTDGITWDWANETNIVTSLNTWTSCVVYESNHWYRFYWSGLGGVIWMANSSDGITFTDDHNLLFGFESFVWIAAGTWYMLYIDPGGGVQGDDLNLATSPDGYTWTDYGSNPVIGSGNAISAYGYRPFVVASDSTFYMIATDHYRGFAFEQPAMLRILQSTDAINWTNSTIPTIVVGDQWRANRDSTGALCGVPNYRRETSAYPFDGPDGHFMMYCTGYSWLAEARGYHSFPQIAEGEIYQFGYTMFEGCANNVTASGVVWHYGVNEFDGIPNKNITITPAVGPVNVTIYVYAPGSYNNTENAIWFTANQTPAGSVLFYVRLKASTTYAVIKDGTELTRFTTNVTGWHLYSYSGAWSMHSFAFRVTLVGTSGVEWSFPSVADSATIRVSNPAYPPTGPGAVYTIMPNTSAEEMRVGQRLAVDYDTYRTYLTFDTSSLPDSATVLSAELRMMIRTAPTLTASSFNVLVYGSNFTSLTTADWSLLNDYQGVLMTAYGGMPVNTWRSMGIATDQINLTGVSQFGIRSSLEGTAPDYGVEAVRFWNMSSAYYPVLMVKVQVLGTILAIENDAGNWYNSSIFPEVQDWNLTYDLLYFSFSTFPTAKNATILKQSTTWAVQGLAPDCNYTENSTQVRLEDVFDSIEYRVWFTSPKAYAYTLCHIALYDQFTGEGLFWEQMRLVVSNGATYDPSTAVTVANPDQLLNCEQNYTFTVMDYFGNLVTNYSVYTSTSQMDIYIPVPIYSYKFYNQNPVFALLRVHYNLTGAPYSEFIPPYDYVNRYLKAGTYRFNITFYNASGFAGSTYTWVRTIPSITFPGAGYVILEGDTISEAIAAAEGVRAIVQVVADLVTPSIIWIGYNMPQVPAYLMTVPIGTVYNNRYLVDSDITQTRTGWLLNFSTPVPFNVTVSTVISDDFRFVGNLSTQIYVNTSTTNVYNSANLPAGISLAGGTYTIWTNRTISAVRDTHFRWERTFTYQYFPETDMYQADISFNNTAGIQWRNVTVFVSFQNNTKVNNGSVLIYDMNNTVYLTEGVHYVLSTTGIHMWFPTWNASLWRGFRVTYTTVNETEFTIPAVVVVNVLGDGTSATMPWQGSTYYFAIASWTNTYNMIYTGPLYITLELQVSIDPTTVVVLADNGVVITSAIVFGNTVAIPEITLEKGEKITYTVLFQSTVPKSPMDIEFAGIPVMFVAMAVMLAAFILGVVLVIIQKDKRVKQFGYLLLGLAVLALGFIVIIFIYFVATA